MRPVATTEGDDASDPNVDLDEVHDQELVDQWSAAHEAVTCLVSLFCLCFFYIVLYYIEIFLAQHNLYFMILELVVCHT